MLERLNGETRLFPIIGDPIIYVKSPERLTSSFAARGHNGICVPMQVPAGGLANVIHGLTPIHNIDGLLITMPHKFTAYPYCATRSERARRLEVVNVIRRNADGSWHGDMIDGLAFAKAQQDHGAQLEGARALLVGAGGAGSAIAITLLEAGVRQLIIHDTNEARVTDLMRRVANLGRGRVVAGPSDPTGCDMVCNATPLGMAEGDPLPVAGRFARPVAVRGRRDRWTWGNSISGGCPPRRLQDSEWRSDGRGRAGDDARFYARHVMGWHSEVNMVGATISITIASDCPSCG